MDTGSEPGQEHHQETAGHPLAVPTVPLRPDGWPDWLGRRPMSSSDRARLRQALTEGLPEGPLADAGPFLCYLTIDGLDRTDPGKLIRLRGRIHAAARTAAEGRQTTYHATDSTISIGIRGPDAADRISQLRRALAQLIAKHGWTIREQPRLPGRGWTAPELAPAGQSGAEGSRDGGDPA